MDELTLSPQDKHTVKQCRDFIRVGEKVKEMLASPGWREVIEPLLNKNIIDVLGGYENGRWHNGSLDRAKKEERKEFLLGYKAALINFHGAVYSYIDELVSSEKTLEDIESRMAAKYDIPMIGGEYAGGSSSED